MRFPPLPLHYYRPSEPQPTYDKDDGSIRLEVHTVTGVVRVFTYPGGVHGSDFTTLHVYRGRDGRLYHTRLPRHYHERWLRRLAYAFSDQVEEVANA